MRQTGFAGRLALSAGLALLAALVPAACQPAAPDAPAEAAQAAPLMRVTILGSGTPVPSRSQTGTAILVEAGGEVILVDCGNGCTARLAEYDPGLLTRVDHVFLTHLHSDHVVGLPDLWLNGWTQGREGEFRVWGPAGTEALFDGLRAAYDADISIRTRARLAAGGGPLTVEAQSLPPEGGVIVDTGAVKVTAFPVVHAGMPAFGYRLEHAGKVVVISGDTTATPTLAEAGQGADLYLMEVLSPALVGYLTSSFSEARARAILGLHLTASQAAGVMAETEPGLAVYYHTVASCSTDGALLAQTAETYGGAVMVSRDLMQIRLWADDLDADYLGEDPADCD